MQEMPEKSICGETSAHALLYGGSKMRYVVRRPLWLMTEKNDDAGYPMWLRGKRAGPQPRGIMVVRSSCLLSLSGPSDHCCWKKTKSFSSSWCGGGDGGDARKSSSDEPDEQC